MRMLQNQLRMVPKNSSAPMFRMADSAAQSVATMIGLPLLALTGDVMSAFDPKPTCRPLRANPKSAMHVVRSALVLRGQPPRNVWAERSSRNDILARFEPASQKDA